MTRTNYHLPRNDGGALADLEHSLAGVTLDGSSVGSGSHRYHAAAPHGGSGDADADRATSGTGNSSAYYEESLSWDHAEDADHAHHHHSTGDDGAGMLSNLRRGPAGAASTYYAGDDVGEDVDRTAYNPAFGMMHRACCLIACFPPHNCAVDTSVPRVHC
ncbi:hypothetical protein EON62_03410 [archaeon]|nr:MAG: hypothetical protein EON62_03410 [archaeon]